MTTKIRLSILLVTYNHGNFIHQAINSIIRQNICETIEIVVADDASTDNTLDIIRSYDGLDSRFSFKYLDTKLNLGITKNYQRGFAACSGEYVAVLEGDDYWTSPAKLQRQIDFLDNHFECDLCSVNYFIYEEGRSHLYARTTIGNHHKLLNARDLIADNLVGNFSTCMYRRSALDLLPKKLYEITSYDWIVNICIARQSFIGFLESPMSVYRLHSSGVWTQTSQMEKVKIQLELIPSYDELTNYVFRDDFHMLANRLSNAMASMQLANLTDVARPLSSKLPILIDFIPPILRIMLGLFVPPILKRVLVRVIHRSY